MGNDDSDDDDDTSSENSSDTASEDAPLSIHPAHSERSSTPPVALPPLHLLDTESTLHKSYATLQEANREALKAFLAYVKSNSWSYEDRHYYAHFVEPDMTALFDASGAGQRTCTVPVHIEWDPPTGRQHRWPFVRLVAEVVESKLEGPVELGDMLVEGPPPGGEGNGEALGLVESGSQGVGQAGQRQGTPTRLAASRRVGEARIDPVWALLSPLEEETEEGEVSEEE